jgi:arsenite-transporting ATPase
VELSKVLYAEGEDPAAVNQIERPYSFLKQGDHYEVRLRLPFAEKGEVKLFKKEDELVVEVGTLRRHIGLPTTMTHLQPARARLERDVLVVEMRKPS